MPDFPGVDQVSTLTNTTLLELDALPRHLVVVGGSYIGLEFAQMFRRFGAEVTVVEKSPRLVEPRGRGRVGRDPRNPRSGGHRDPLRRRMHPLRAARARISRSGSIARAGEPEVVGSHVLLAVGRRPNTDDLGPRGGGRRRSTRAATSSSTTGCGRASPTSGRSATATAGAPSPIRPTTTSRSSPRTCSTAAPRRVSDRIPGYALYIDPPLGRVGLTEAEAQRERPCQSGSASGR